MNKDIDEILITFDPQDLLGPARKCGMTTVAYAAMAVDNHIRLLEELNILTGKALLTTSDEPNLSFWGKPGLLYRDALLKRLTKQAEQVGMEPEEFVRVAVRDHEKLTKKVNRARTKFIKNAGG